MSNHKKPACMIYNYKTEIRTSVMHGGLECKAMQGKVERTQCERGAARGDAGNGKSVLKRLGEKNERGDGALYSTVHGRRRREGKQLPIQIS